MLKEEQIALLKDISASIAFDDRQAAVDQLVMEGYLVKDGDLYELTAKGEMEVEAHAALRSPR
jgi:predicted transcriptional regulator